MLLPMFLMAKANTVLIVKDIEMCFGEGGMKLPRKNHLYAHTYCNIMQSKTQPEGVGYNIICLV